MLEQYQKDIYFIESLSNIPRKNYMLGLKDRSIFVERTRKFLTLLGSPEKKLKFIHVAGTSGKGTTSKILQALMADAGYKVGAYTSPFATTSIEKISIGDKLIDPKSLHKILEEKIKPAWDIYTKKYKDDPISYFETWLAIALLYFQEQKCDWVVLEAGLGGTHDATNVIPQAKITAITNIGMDHTEILGNSREKIAKDKAGIIKKNSIFVTTEKNKKLLKIFRAVCKKKKAWYMETENIVKDYKTDNYFDTTKQKENLNLALNILQLLKIDPKNTQSIINSFKLTCRQEIIQKNPLVILDGSHNKDKLANLIDFVQKQKYKNLHLLVAFAQNKNYKIPFKKLLKISDEVYLTRFLMTERKSASLRDMQKIAKSIKTEKSIYMYNDPYQALDTALKSAKKDDLILVTGSFFLSGELRKKWVSEEFIVKNLKLDNK
ncbi:hypothetical protein C0580_00750 [Candidatus Parcubacteria bacterium]|nr:MAG: hypothetical protein C0580_00750 [Candidatus Parcubacteria bacterium]